MRGVAILTIMAGLLIGGQAFAQHACALHIWPARATTATTAGVLSNLGLAGAYADYRTNRDANLHAQALLIEALTPPAQAQAMAQLDLPRLFGLDHAAIVYESGNLDRRAATKRRDRLAASPAACHAELVVTLNEFRDSAVRGVSLKSHFAFRDFRTGKLRIVTGTAASPLARFPARDASGDVAARQELAAAFAANLRDFAGQVGRRSR